MLGLGANLLARSGPRPVGTSSVLSDLGQSLGASTQGWPGMLEGAASQAFQLNQLALQAKQRQAVQDFISQHPLPENASPSEVRSWVAQAIPAFLASGNEAGVAQLGQLMTGLEGGTPSFEKGVYNGKPAIMRVAKDGTSTPVLGPDGQPLAPTPDQATLDAHLASVQNNLQNQFRGDQQLQDLLGQRKTVTTAVGQARLALNGNAAAQFGLLDNFIRTFNPKAIVRGNTIEQFKDLLPWSQQLAGKFQAAAEGKGGLPPETIRQMMDALQQVENANSPSLERSFGRYRALAAKHPGLDPDELFDFTPAPDFSGVTSAPTPGVPHPGKLSAKARQVLGH